MARDLQSYDLLQEYVKVLEQQLDMERGRAEQAEEGEKRALEIAEGYRKIDTPTVWDTALKVGIGVSLGVLLMEFARD